MAHQDLTGPKATQMPSDMALLNPDAQLERTATYNLKLPEHENLQPNV